MRATLSILIASAICFGTVPAAEPDHGRNNHGEPAHGKHGAAPPGHPKQNGAPPGLAKHGGLPPGLAKKLGRSAPERCYVAVDPRYDDRAWFLIDGRWVLKQGFDASVRVEVRQVKGLPALPSPPPVPLPKLSVGLHVVLFG